MPKGIYTGMLDVYVAKMTGTDSASSKPTYGAPQVLGMGIEVSITPNYAEGELYASNAVARRAKSIVSYGITINTEAMDPALVAYATGRVKDANGVQVIKGGNVSGKIALGFVRTKDNGTKEFWWLYKGELAEAAVTAKTSTGSIEYQTPSLEGTFDRRIYDDALACIVDEEDTGIASGVLDNWFTQVYEPEGAAEPGVDELPIGKVLTVATLPTGGIDATAVYVLTAEDGEKASGTMWRQISGEWVQYGV